MHCCLKLSAFRSDRGRRGRGGQPIAFIHVYTCFCSVDAFVGDTRTEEVWRLPSDFFFGADGGVFCVGGGRGGQGWERWFHLRLFFFERDFSWESRKKWVGEATYTTLTEEDGLVEVGVRWSGRYNTSAFGRGVVR